MREGNLVFWICGVADTLVACAAAVWAVRGEPSATRFAGALRDPG